jgi:hypothetical protein
MQTENELSTHVQSVLNHLANIQNADGSFDTYYLQPQYHQGKGWMKFPGNAPYDTATTVLPLLQMSDSVAKDIVSKASAYLKKQSLDGLLWTYAYETSDYLIPYDTDSTSLASYVLSKQSFEINNKEFLNSLINHENYYPFYVWLKHVNWKIPFSTFVKMIWRDVKVKRCIPIVNDDMRVTDAEFSSTCINLLYLGRTTENERVWQKVKNVLASGDIDHMYYIDIHHSLYHAFRLAHFTQQYDILPEENVLNGYMDRLEDGLNDFSFSDRTLLFTLCLLFLQGRTEKDVQTYAETVLRNLSSAQYTQIFASYSSNVNTDHQSDLTPNTYFGSVGATCAHYLEFLELYSTHLTQN